MLIQIYNSSFELQTRLILVIYYFMFIKTVVLFRNKSSQYVDNLIARDGNSYSDNQ